MCYSDCTMQSSLRRDVTACFRKAAWRCEDKSLSPFGEHQTVCSSEPLLRSLTSDFLLVLYLHISSSQRGRLVTVSISHGLTQCVSVDMQHSCQFSKGTINMSAVTDPIRFFMTCVLGEATTLFSYSSTEWVSLKTLFVYNKFNFCL